MASEDVQAAIEASGESTLNNATRKAQEQMNELFNISLDIAVTGETGAGKSSFVNAYRGLNDDDEGAAETGVTETTTEPTGYKHPTLPNVTMWDLPGIGSPNIKAKKYLKDVQLNRYDFFIILCSGRFKECDILLAKEIKKQKKHFYFVRSKLDDDLRAAARRRGFNKEKILSKIKRDCIENLKEFENPKVFLISSVELKDFDFEELIETLESDLPKHKQYALLQSVPVSSKAMLQKKVKMFEKAAWAAAICSGVIAAAPVPGLSLACDAAILASFFMKCYYSFGLDDNSLRKLSERVNKPHLKSLITSPLVLALANKSAVRLQLSALAGSEVAECLCSLVPGVGSAAAAMISFGITLKLLKKGIKDLESAALDVLREAGLE